MRKLIAFLSGALAAQGFTALTGLLLTRWLDVHDYAVYTVLAVLTGAMAVLTTGGVNIALSAIVGRHWPDRERASQALHAGLRERRLISVLVLPVFFGVAIWLLHRASAPAWLVAALVVVLLAQWHFDMSSRMYDQILLYAHRAVGLQALDAALAFGRLAGVVLLQLAGAIGVLAVSLVGAVAAWLRVPPIRRWAARELPAQAPALAASDQREIRAMTMRQLPVEIFYCFQGQIALFILALAATPADTASYGALNRIGQLFVPISMLVSSYAIPRFSQVREGVFRAFFAWSLLGLLPGVVLVGVAAFAPGVLLLLIGPHYAGLQHEVFVATFGSALAMFAGTAWRLAAHRGWARWTLVQIPVALLWCAVAPQFLALSTLSGVLWFQAGFPLAALCATGADLLAARRAAPSTPRTAEA